jgi:hypothetical protein
MNAFYEHHKNSIQFGYRCFDRLLLNGLIQPFQQPERVLGFFNAYREGKRVTRRTLTEIADQFQYWLKNRSEKWGAPILDPPDGAETRQLSLSTRFGPLRCSHLAPLKDQNPCRLLFCSRWPRPKRSPAPRFLRRVRAKRRPGPPRTGDQNIVGGTRPSGSNCWLYPIRSVAVLSPR